MKVRLGLIRVQPSLCSWIDGHAWGVPGGWNDLLAGDAPVLDAMAAVEAMDRMAPQLIAMARLEMSRIVCLAAVDANWGT